MAEQHQASCSAIIHYLPAVISTYQHCITLHTVLIQTTILTTSSHKMTTNEPMKNLYILLYVFTEMGPVMPVRRYHAPHIRLKNLKTVTAWVSSISRTVLMLLNPLSPAPVSMK